MKRILFVCCFLGCIDSSRTSVEENELDASTPQDIGVENPFANCSELRDSYDEQAQFETCYPAVDETGCLRLRLELANGAWCQLDRCLAQVSDIEQLNGDACEFYFGPHENHNPTTACGCFSQDVTEGQTILARGNEILCTPVYCIH